MKLRKTLKKGVIMPMSLSHKSVKKHNKKLPANVTKNKILVTIHSLSKIAESLPHLVMRKYD